MEIILNMEGIKKFDGVGDKMTIQDFIECCEDHSFIDYDGFANELVLDDKVVWNKEFIYPSELLVYRTKLLHLSKQYPNLRIVWYNR